jgi:hypothetical protein
MKKAILKTIRNNLGNVCDTIEWVVILSAIWALLEVSLYGEVQPSAVDNIMIMLFTPFIFHTVSSKNQKKEQKRKSAIKPIESDE